MGCCLSSHRPSASSSASAPQNHHVHLEEETVKEVLSETPKPKPPHPAEGGDEGREQKKNAVVLKPKPAPRTEESRELEVAPPPSEEEISQVSELCSLSESASTAADKRDDGEARRKTDGSPAKFRLHGEAPARREKGVAMSPARRADPWLGRGRAGPRSAGSRRDIGEISARRSRSPATTRANPEVSRSGSSGAVGRSPSSRKTGRSPSRVPPTSLSRRTVAAQEMSCSRNDSESPAPANESLENPLVSLECFIFL